MPLAACVPGAARSSLPLVSVLILTCNRPGFLRLALEAARAQDYPHIEAVVVDDGSVPASREGLRGVSVPVRLIRLPRRATIGGKRNHATRAARGAVLLHWDDDDLHPPDQVSKLVCPILRNESDITALTFTYLGRLTSTQASFFKYGASGQTSQRPGQTTFQPFLGSIAYSRAAAAALTGRPNILYGATGSRTGLHGARATHGELAPFADVSLGEDMHFVERAVWSCLRMLPVEGVDLVYTRHRAVSNTWRPEFFKRNTSKYSIVDERMAVPPPPFVSEAIRRKYVAAEVDAKATGACAALQRHAPPGIRSPTKFPYMPERCCVRGSEPPHALPARLYRPCPGGGRCGDTFCGPTKGVCTARCTCPGEPAHGAIGGAKPCGTLCCRYWHDFWPKHPQNCSGGSVRPLKAHYCGGVRLSGRLSSSGVPGTPGSIAARAKKRAASGAAAGPAA